MCVGSTMIKALGIQLADPINDLAVIFEVSCLGSSLLETGVEFIRNGNP
jgi:hypothetical protein